ncbi:MAG: UDP-N-acetylglucosamine 2-epimerase [Deltaproteobacteria bacterium]
MKVLAITGTRADWGLMRPVLRALDETKGIDLRLAVTGQHLLHGNLTEGLIGADGFAIDYRVDMALSSDDSPRAIGIAMGKGLSGMADVLSSARPDLLLVLGDRYEILAAVSAALLARVPVAHIAGGDVTEGAFDDSIRHAITKLSSLHFVTNAEACARVIQMGEDPTRVHLTGSPGIDAILEVPRLSRADLLKSVGLPLDARLLFLVTFHPATLSTDSDRQFGELLRALDLFPDSHVIFTGSNADPGARQIDAMAQDWIARSGRAVFHQSLGSQRYFSAMASADVVIGNSSSGLYEAPSFGIPTVNIGDRQARRPRATSVFDCNPNAEAIAGAIRKALSGGRLLSVGNPFGNGTAAKQIATILGKLDNPAQLVRKSFRDITP